MVCDLCGHHKQTVEHLVWDCPALQTVRQEQDNDLSKYGKLLPKPLKHGIAPPQIAGFNRTYWGQEWISDLPREAEQLFGIEKGIPIEEDKKHLAALKEAEAEAYRKVRSATVAGSVVRSGELQLPMASSWALPKAH